MNPADRALSFERLVTAIGLAHAELAARASRAINASLTLRNWLIGLRIVECEQRGTDCAEYGVQLIEQLSRRLGQAGFSRTEVRELRHCRQFYVTYPGIRKSLTPDLPQALPPKQEAASIRASPDLRLGVCATDVLMKLSFTHIADLLQCDESPLEGDNSPATVAADESVNSKSARASRNDAGSETNGACVGIPYSTHTPCTPTKKYTACIA